ncbi:MAG: hypothetical protein QGH15_20110 [Kiritimatiellia bacterium]|jgi:hypothetical protein|nr:hypothetical protein [Kiritimatiellia bacterium]
MRSVYSIDVRTTAPGAIVSSLIKASLASLAQSIPPPAPDDPHPRTVRLYVIARSGLHIHTPEELAIKEAPATGILPTDLAAVIKAAKKTRTGNNAAHREFLRTLPPELHAVKRGWPDFFLISDKGNLSAVEVKASRGRTLKALQLACMRILARYGIPAYRWSKATGYERIGIASPVEASSVVEISDVGDHIGG